MITRVVAVDPDQPDLAILDEAVAILRSGGLVAFGTETVYGLGGDATDPTAVARIFAAKGRPPTNPLIVHVADLKGAIACVAAWPPGAQRLADHHWPGPLTLVLPRSGLIPDIVTTGQGTVGVRMPASLVARELIRRAGCPIAAPSANQSNRISPTTAAHVRQDLDGRVDLILDTGPCAVGIESTVLSLAGDVPMILRPGEVTHEQITATLRMPVAHFAGSVAPDQPALSPGQLAVHYAPRTPAYRLTRQSWPSSGLGTEQRWGLILLGKPVIGFDYRDAAVVTSLESPTAAAAGLYNQLHRLDALGLDFVVVVVPDPAEPGWVAVLDRVVRATRPWPVG